MSVISFVWILILACQMNISQYEPKPYIQYLLLQLNISIEYFQAVDSEHCSHGDGYGSISFSQLSIQLLQKHKTTILK